MKTKYEKPSLIEESQISRTLVYAGNPYDSVEAGCDSVSQKIEVKDGEAKLI